MQSCFQINNSVKRKSGKYNCRKKADREPKIVCDSCFRLFPPAVYSMYDEKEMEQLKKETVEHLLQLLKEL